MSFFLGLDLGQASDPTAIAICERVEVPSPVGFSLPGFPGETSRPDAPAKPSEIHLRHLERLKLGTSYPEVVAHVCKLMRSPKLHGQTELIVDATGVGRPVVDMLHAAGLALTAVTITGGDKITRDEGNWRVPKRDLVVGLQVLLQEGRLKIADRLPEADTLKRELMGFKVKIDPVSAHDSYNAREGAHDDLVLAAALAAWRAKSFEPFVMLFSSTEACLCCPRCTSARSDTWAAAYAVVDVADSVHGLLSKLWRELEQFPELRAASRSLQVALVKHRVAEATLDVLASPIPNPNP